MTIREGLQNQNPGGRGCDCRIGAEKLCQEPICPRQAVTAPRPFKPGDRVQTRGNPTGIATVTFVGDTRVTVRMDTTGHCYAFPLSALTHLPPEEPTDEA